MALPAVIGLLRAGVNGMASRTSHFATCVSSANPPGMSGLVLMATETGFVGGQPRQLGRIPDIGRLDRLRMLAGSFVAGLAGGLHLGVTQFGQIVDNFVVTTGTGVGRLEFILLLLLAEEGHGESHQKKKEVTTEPGRSTEHEPDPR